MTRQRVAAVMSIQDRFERRPGTRKSAREYGLLIGPIAIAIIAVLVLLGPKLAGMSSEVDAKLPTTGSWTDVPRGVDLVRGSRAGPTTGRRGRGVRTRAALLLLVVFG